ncbi:S-layer homology domain-containing protein [Gordonibacter sp.]|uniref:S-layer homology domain-containing protein n=1 Tax=Gordonibacter sp. TaxID=1968902 RepID=UPI0025C5DFB7|nr:S-layer homology domain-containing protein [Gordonibacter sp.]
MTACVNNEGLSGKKVVSATLAGVLAAGMVPAIAFADEAAEAPTDEGIDLLAAGAIQDFEAGKVTAAAVAGDTTPLNFTSEGVIEVPTKTGVFPLQVKTQNGNVVNLAESNVAMTYYSDKDYRNTIADITQYDQVGMVYAKATISSLADADAAYNGAVLKFSYKMVKSDLLKDATLVDKASQKADFTYGALDVENFVKTLSVMDKGVDILNTATAKVTVDIHVAGSSTALGNGDAMPAGDYVAVIKGVAGQGYDNAQREVKFTLKPLDLSASDILLEDITGTTPAISKINGEAPAADLASALQITEINGPSAILAENGEYTAKVVAADPTNKSIVGSKEASFLKVTTLATMNYKTQGFPSDPVVVVAGDAKKHVSASDFTTASNVVDQDYIILTVTDKDGNEVSLDKMNSTIGTYTITATVDSAKLDVPYSYGGSDSMKVVVSNDATINPNTNLFISYDGKYIATDKDIEYTGSNILDELDIVLRDSKGNELTEGTDYKVEVTKNGKVVTEAIERGTYTIKVTSDTYNIQENGSSVTVTIVPKVISDVRVADLLSYDTYDKASDTWTTHWFLPYTGNAITPVIEYQESPNNWVTLPADTYKITYAYDANESEATPSGSAKEMLKVGSYVLTLTAASNDQNYSFATGSVKTAQMAVSDKKVFGDVKSTDWFFDVVYQASQNGYMNGYFGSNLFGSNDSITRADVVCVLYNMASDGMITDNQPNTPDATYESFADVDSSKYYAKAIAWAKKAGVANGYGDGTFNPEGNVSRQDFACMLGNYAKVVGNFEAPADIDAVLAKYTDGTQVSDYAKESVAWACDKKIMGNGGLIMPQNTITRAEVAAMAVNYQPKPLV